MSKVVHHKGSLFFGNQRYFTVLSFIFFFVLFVLGTQILTMFPGIENVYNTWQIDDKPFYVEFFADMSVFYSKYAFILIPMNLIITFFLARVFGTLFAKMRRRNVLLVFVSIIGLVCIIGVEIFREVIFDILYYIPLLIFDIVHPSV
jgi:hypothetical protein